MVTKVKIAGASSAVKSKQGSVNFTAGVQLTNAATGITGIGFAGIKSITLMLKASSEAAYEAATTGPYTWEFSIGGVNFANTSNGEFWTNAMVIFTPGSISGQFTTLNAVAAGNLTITTLDGVGSGAGPYDQNLHYDIWVEYYEGT